MGESRVRLCRQKRKQKLSLLRHNTMGGDRSLRPGIAYERSLNNILVPQKDYIFSPSNDRVPAMAGTQNCRLLLFG